MRKTRVLVCSPANFDLVSSGLNVLGWPANEITRRYAPLDLAVFQEYDSQQRRYTGRQCARVITQVQFRRKSGHILLSTRELRQEEMALCTR